MASVSPKLDWCVVRLGEDGNWWVEEISDNVRWDVDGLGIIDPRQLSHMIELCDPLNDYGFDRDILENAFFAFGIENDLGEGRIRLSRFRDNILESEEMVFALPDIMDEDKGPYADLLNHITRLRVKMLNDLIDFKQSLTIEELEEEIRENQNQAYMEGRAVHFFTEISSILEYVPEGFELDQDEEGSSASSSSEDIDDDFPDIEESEEKIEEDETMRWDEDEEDDFEEKEESEDEEPREDQSLI